MISSATSIWAVAWSTIGTWKDKNSKSSHQPLQVNQPFFYNGGYKTNKVIKFSEKKQVNEIIRVKIVIILNFNNVKVIFIAFISTM